MIRINNNWLLPRLINWTCGGSTITRQREKIIHLAEGDVLEIGIGSGLNLAHYDWSRITSLTGIDPSPELWNLRHRDLTPDRVPITFIACGAEEIPLDDNSMDTVVSTYSFCSIPEAKAALSEVRRILKPGGKFIFSEHALAPDEGVRKWQNRLNPWWVKVSGGCNLNRDIPAMLTASGLELETLDQMYLPGTKVANWHIWGAGSFKDVLDGE